MGGFKSIEWRGDRLVLLDQRHLPQETRYVEYRSAEAVADAIKEMVVRGAPAIGVAAAFGMVLAARDAWERGAPTAETLARADATLRASRPTAVNLFWALDRVRGVWDGFEGTTAELVARLEAEAESIAEEDIATNRAIARYGAELVPKGAKVLHHCNTGSLATVDYGTALGIIRAAHEAGKEIHAYLDETRPRLQGSRLSAWELATLGIPHTVIVDGASGATIRRFGVDLAVVGADRIAANGDTANKIGTYNLAIVARHHGIPFYVAAPLSTVDLGLASGDEIPIEERSADEVGRIGDVPLTPAGTPVYNPAFDVTPAELITGIITERGVAYPPFTESLASLAGEKE